MSDEKAFTLIAILTTIALALAIVLAFAGMDALKQPASSFASEYQQTHLINRRLRFNPKETQRLFAGFFFIWGHP